jgi:hypothetical protein
MYLFTSVSRPQYVLKATEQLVATCTVLAQDPLDPVLCTLCCRAARYPPSPAQCEYELLGCECRRTPCA